MARLGDICNILSGGTPSRSNPLFWKGGTIPWVKISDIKGKYLNNVEETITDDGLKNSSAKIFPAGTILYSIFATIGEVCILDIDASTNQALAGIQIIDENIDRDYLYYYLVSLKEEASTIGRGVAQNNINIKILRDFVIPLPPLEEQRRIAAILDKVTSLINLRKQQLTKLDELVKARFVEMFGEPGTDIYKWGMLPLGKICQINPKKSSDKRLSIGTTVSFVSMIAVTETGEIDTSKIKEYSEVKTGFTYFAENDVLFAKITPCMENGKGAIARGLCNGVGFGSTEFHVLRPLGSKSNPYWLYVLTTFPKFRIDAASHMTGSAGQRRVPSSFLMNYLVSVPPIALQKKFAAFVEEVNEFKLTVRQNLDILEVLKESLMQECFR